MPKFKTQWRWYNILCHKDDHLWRKFHYRNRQVNEEVVMNKNNDEWNIMIKKVSGGSTKGGDIQITSPLIT